MGGGTSIGDEGVGLEEVREVTEAVAATRPQLGIKEQVIYDRLKNAEREQSIKVLYMAAFDVRFAEMAALSSRTQQQKLGPYIARLNKKLEPKERIVPGEARRTYRLESVPVEG